ncbi:sigma-70 family RNA polymerase sigma factor [Lentisphaera profundi]|uniref:Sigma-70 family RNA polymerase sigma factor n=1 Tax=Lentisphaera profundi TaxID=1658616 RepID=A0ABY7VU39_9BACT|nr:sigma-70 family RNA polymerase sigma factor [Lentisphaera profundi]WDE97577.1 sigma-70 family RNA polymerase sigma factor [Lentisphaera profundi]
MSDNYITRQSLLMRACDGDDLKAWEEFLEFYRNFIYFLLRKMNINVNDIDDLYQRITMHLWKSLPKYDNSKGKFRSWLSTVARNEVLNYFRSNKNKKLEFTAEEPIIIDEPHIDEIIEKEWENFILQTALKNLESVFSGQAIEVFKLSLEGNSHHQISEKTEIKIDSVKVLKSRVKSRCVEEIKRLIHEYSD